MRTSRLSPYVPRWTCIASNGIRFAAYIAAGNFNLVGIGGSWDTSYRSEKFFQIGFSYTAVDITRTDWAHAFTATERQGLERKADLRGVQLLPHTEDLVVQMMGVSRSVLFAQAA